MSGHDSDLSGGGERACGAYAKVISRATAALRSGAPKQAALPELQHVARLGAALCEAKSKAKSVETKVDGRAIRVGDPEESLAAIHWLAAYAAARVTGDEAALDAITALDPHAHLPNGAATVVPYTRLASTLAAFDTAAPWESRHESAMATAETLPNGRESTAFHVCRMLDAFDLTAFRDSAKRGFFDKVLKREGPWAIPEGPRVERWDEATPAALASLTAGDGASNDLSLWSVLAASAIGASWGLRVPAGGGLAPWLFDGSAVSPPARANMQLLARPTPALVVTLTFLRVDRGDLVSDLLVVRPHGALEVRHKRVDASRAPSESWVYAARTSAEVERRVRALMLAANVLHDQDGNVMPGDTGVVMVTVSDQTRSVGASLQRARAKSAPWSSLFELCEGLIARITGARKVDDAIAALPLGPVTRVVGA
jgi:hypothetical protein